MIKKKGFNILYFTIAFLVLVITIFLTWALAYSNYYVNKVEDDVKNDNYEVLLKNYEYYDNEPTVVNKTEDFDIHIFKVVALYRNEEGIIVNNAAYSFFISDINTEIINIKNNNQNDKDLSKMVITCDGKEKEFPIQSKGYDRLKILNFNLMFDDVKNVCTDKIDKIQLFDAKGNEYYSNIDLLVNFDVDDIQEEGTQGDTPIQVFFSLFPIQVIIPMLLVTVFYIGILILLWYSLKRFIYKNK